MNPKSCSQDCYNATRVRKRAGAGRAAARRRQCYRGRVERHAGWWVVAATAQARAGAQRRPWRRTTRPRCVNNNAITHVSSCNPLTDLWTSRPYSCLFPPSIGRALAHMQRHLQVSATLRSVLYRIARQCTGSKQPAGRAMRCGAALVVGARQARTHAVLGSPEWRIELLGHAPWSRQFLQAPQVFLLSAALRPLVRSLVRASCSARTTARRTRRGLRRAPTKPGRNFSRLA